MDGIIYLTLEQAEVIHKKTIKYSGGGIYESLDTGKLESVLQHIQNDEYYPTFVDKLTHLFFCTCEFHCFADGNKRLAITLSLQFLLFNGYMGIAKNFMTITENIIMNYDFMIYICEGNESEKLDWFKVVNIGGEKLTEQELRNSVYTGEWLSDAKRYFSKRNCAAKGLSDKYITGDPNRQELLEKALKGICDYQGIKDITEYMAAHKSDNDADELWQYFQDVIRWAEKIFPKYYSDMKGLDWCHLYNEYHNNSYNSSVMNTEVKRLHEDEDVKKTKGIYEYLLCKDIDPFAGRLLNLRAFDKRDKMAAYSKQDGICPICKQHFEFEEMEGDHIKPWSKGGHTIPENCQMLCKECNGKKTDKY